MTIGDPPGVFLGSLHECVRRFGHPRDWNQVIVTDWFRRRCRAILAGDAAAVARIDAEREREPGEE